MLRLEDLVADDSVTDPEREAERHELAQSLHRAMAQLPALWRRVLERIHLADSTPAEAAAALGLDAAEVDRIALSAAAFLRAKLIEAGFAGETVETANLEQEIGRFSVIEHDGVIVGCAALYPYGDEGDQDLTAELACLAVSHEHRRWGYGERLMHHIADKARQIGVSRLFVLTTRTTHWFIERGFELASVDALPSKKRLMYNYQRRSKVLMKTLEP